MKNIFINKTEALLITSRPNILYFSGIDTASGIFLLLTDNKKFVFTDARYIAEAAKVAHDYIPIATNKDNFDWWSKVIKKNRIKTIYFEPYYITYNEFLHFRKISQSIARIKQSPIDLRLLRSIKNKQELLYIKKAAKIAQEIMLKLVKIIRNRMSKQKISEYDLILEIWKQTLNRDCKLSFDPIVAFGKSSAVPHHQASRVRYLKPDDMVLIDMGVLYNNYCSDITRTFFTAPPTSLQAEIYNKVLSVQQQTINKVKAGILASKLYNDVAAYFGNLSPYFTHGLGHGLGLEIHEYPNLKSKSPDLLKAGQVVTIEPGLYFNWGGVRIEDMVVVTNSSYRLLTDAPKELREVIL